MPATALYAVVVLIWGSSWLGIKFQLGVVPVELSVAYRYMAAAAILWAYCFAARRKLGYGRRDHAFMAAQGFFLFYLNYELFYLAAGRLPSGLLAVAFSTIIVMNIFNGAVFFRHAVDRRIVLAAAAGIAGLVLLFWSEFAELELSGDASIGLALSLAATYCASLGNMLAVRHKMAGVPLVQSNTWGMTYGAGFAFLTALVMGVPLEFDARPLYVGSLIYLALFATVIGFSAYLTLVHRIGADRAAYVTVVFPLVALGLSTLFEGYEWTPPAVAGVALVLAGNLLVLRRRAPLHRQELVEP